ncbi:TetR family transcriptional regulator [Ktedonobacter sp. SOSP1-85]|uniref:TetR/AcrR family transcriptional regulator n=1 Tax=Ktedonobacter sp. SOSP1-85 TaxID=2778367 RepID=UPI0019161CA8|nr:TetR/AcrR family transcriptional regulator [Ktedonobacter sp. SOSP1-85]GHO78381.1 TetR family transcriptional regulator [Ktedonobacter sp. SOSP1-85]
MSLKQRREREKQAMRQGILEAARQLARTEGWSAVTIRKIAEQIEYSPPMVYEYFASKDDLLLELLREGYRDLATTMQHTSHATEDSEQRLLSIGNAYCQFARAYPELYQVMNGLGGVPLEAQERMLAAREVCRITLEALTAWTQSNGVTLANPDETVEILWALLHGLVSLYIIDRSQEEVLRAERLAQQTLQSLLAAWSISKSVH